MSRGDRKARRRRAGKHTVNQESSTTTSPEELQQQAQASVEQQAGALVERARAWRELCQMEVDELSYLATDTDAFDEPEREQLQGALDKAGDQLRHARAYLVQCIRALKAGVIQAETDQRPDDDDDAEPAEHASSDRVETVAPIVGLDGQPMGRGMTRDEFED